MEWNDDGVILGVRRHGETSVIVEALTRHHGRHLGLVRGGRSLRRQPLLQPGNAVVLNWRARLEDQLGHYAVEAGELHAARLMGSAVSLFGLTHITALIGLLPEREAHEPMFETLQVVISQLHEPDLVGPLVVRLELALLAALGFGLDLASCAVTGATQSLTHVSPKSGRAVSASAAAPYLDRLMPLPAFLNAQAIPVISRVELANGFALTEHFLRRHVLEPRGLAEPDARASLITALERNGGYPVHSAPAAD